jgi:hypothetical protein
LDFDSSGYRDVATSQTIEYRGWAFSVGAQAQLSPKFSVGGYIKPRSSGNWTHDYRKSDSDSVQQNKNSGEAPGEVGVGLALKLSKGYTLVGDVKYGMWSEQDLRELFGASVRNVHNPIWVSLGDERTLERVLEAKSGISAWRVGAFYREHYWPYKSSGNAAIPDDSRQNTDLGLTLGGTMFVSSGAGLIHGALELGNRSQKMPWGESIKENFGRLSIQIEIAEKWFQKSKRRGVK